MIIHFSVETHKIVEEDEDELDEDEEGLGKEEEIDPVFGSINLRKDKDELDDEEEAWGKKELDEDDDEEEAWGKKELDEDDDEEEAWGKEADDVEFFISFEIKQDGNFRCGNFSSFCSNAIPQTEQAFESESLNSKVQNEQDL